MPQQALDFGSKQKEPKLKRPKTGQRKSMLAPKQLKSDIAKREAFSVERDYGEPEVELYNDKILERQESHNIDFVRKRTVTSNASRRKAPSNMFHNAAEESNFDNEIQQLAMMGKQQQSKRNFNKPPISQTLTKATTTTMRRPSLRAQTRNQGIERRDSSVGKFSSERDRAPRLRSAFRSNNSPFFALNQEK